MRNRICVFTCPICKSEQFDNLSKKKCLFLYKCEYCGKVNKVAKNEICFFKS